MNRKSGFIACILVSALVSMSCFGVTPDLSLHDSIVNSLIAELASEETAASAAENLGMLRAYSAAEALAATLGTGRVETRRAVALSLAWCGGRKQIPVLLDALDDPDWSVRQSAWVALTNLTGMELPFDAHMKTVVRGRQAKAWRDWWESLPRQGVPKEIMTVLSESAVVDLDLAVHCPVQASSTYKGPASVLTDPHATGFWQTKHVPFPQHCTVDLGKVREFGGIAVDQYGSGFCMTDYAVEVSRDGQSFREVFREKKRTAPGLTIPLEGTEARFVRIVSHAAENPTYPTTFYQVSVFEETPREQIPPASPFLQRERVLRAYGSLAATGGSVPVVNVMRPYVQKTAKDAEEKLMVQAGIRTLGRLADDEARSLLIGLLDNPQWARYAADALGDCGGSDAVSALIAAYPSYAMGVNRSAPSKLPKDDKPGFEAVDRMYETPYAIAQALSRFPLKDEDARRGLRSIAPLLVANMASDFDGAMIYEEQAFQRVTAYLLEMAGMRRAVCEIAFEALGRAEATSAATVMSDETRQSLLALAAKGPGGTSYAASWLSALCRDRDYVPHLVALLEHENGWVRINAAKTLMFMNERSAVDPIATLLESSKTEAEHGYFTGFLFKAKGRQGQDEYNAPSPCWREAFTRALGPLGSKEHVPLLVRLLNDDSNVLEVQYSAAMSLDKIGTPVAVDALVEAAAAHPFHSVRLLAREALWKRGAEWDTALPEIKRTERSAKPAPATPEALVFIKGDNNMPNDFQIDIWRQAYSTTDSGPTYRLGDNLYLLKPIATNGVVTPLTAFSDGYVADCEVSWDGTHVVFARREGDSPWWHIYELELDSRELTQLTDGPYHDVQPAYLPDGRIVFSSSRCGMRDEYHGYPATGLTVMNRDGAGMHSIGFNLGRDNEPAILPDGKIVFSRLELFYSRLKTEITVQTVRPDGTMNETIYGPEKRALWRDISRLSGEKGWGEAPPRHRVLRLTQPQPFGRQKVVVATTGGATILGSGRLSERIIPRWNDMTVTSPFPLDENTILCASTKRTRDRKAVDLGIYTLDVRTGEQTLIYNAPETADFEARPVMSRPVPAVLPTMVQKNSYTARLMCNSARTSQEAMTRRRGKLIRIVEGQPITGRHHTHMNESGEAWKNHTGTHARILGTAPLASDGSFFVEIPADRLVHCQVLDSDRRVVGNQLIWMYARPGETRSCVGCHEEPDTTPVAGVMGFPASAAHAPVKCLPSPGDYSYRAKAWRKGSITDETEERTRTVNAIALPGRM